MGRYTTVQAYGDSNPNMRAVSYEQAGGGVGMITTGSSGSTAVASSSASSSLKTEKVSNPYGSTAGAGSGEFHIYRQMRSREMSRLKKLDEEESDRIAEEEYQSKVLRDQSECMEKTSKKRRKRQRAKESLRRKKVLKQNQILGNDNTLDNNDNDEEDDEFQYTPLFDDTSSASKEKADINGDNDSDNHNCDRNDDDDDSPKKDEQE